MSKKNKIIIITITIMVLLLILLFDIFQLPNKLLKKIYKFEYKDIIYKYSEENDIDPLLTAAIIKAESNYKRNIKSKSGAIGLMQLMEETALEEAEEVGESISVTEKLYNPEVNIKIGTKYFAKLMNRYDNNYMLALAAYNAGMGKVDSWIEEGIISKDGTDLENIPLKETNSYVRKVVRNYKIYKKLY